MEWTDDGIVLGVRRHGEANAILEVMTHGHGRHLGLVRGGAGSRLRPVLQPGNSVRVVWRARLDEHLGNYTVEALHLRAATFLGAAHAVYGVTHVAALCRLLPERDAHPTVYAALEAILDDLGDADAAALRIVRFELQLLAELGFGLDLDSCAVTGQADDLIYVSPKSGRAVSRQAGAAWRDKLLALPAFLCADEAALGSPDDIAAAFALTGFFLARDVLSPRDMAWDPARSGFIAAALRSAPAAG
jgi:DNA repair protein RecO (recombination protein O)